MKLFIPYYTAKGKVVEKYTEKQIEQLKNVGKTKTFGVDNEEFVRFLDCRDNYPLEVLMIGKTYPNKNYYVYREKSNISVMEFINEGEGYVISGDKKIKVRKGDIIYLREGDRHNYYTDKKNPYTKTWMNFNSPIVDALAEKTGVARATVIHCPDAGAYFDALIETASSGVANLSRVNTIFQLVVSILLRAGDELNIESSYSLADKIKELLDCAVYSSKNINEISDELHLSRQHVSKLFTTKFGVSPIQYLADKKIDAAKRALKYTDVPVKKICGMLGFSSQQYFSLVFKSKTGLRPVEYRKQCSKND